MRITVHSNVGKRRTTNQDYADYFQLRNGQTLFVLCDGVGGHQAGDVASKMTTEYLGERFLVLEEPLTLQNANEWLLQAIQDVNTHVYEQSLTKPEWENMGTTLVIALNVEDQLLIAHVGDSRAYSYMDGVVTQLTSDHSLVNELIRTGKITEEEGLHHPYRNAVIQSIGNTPEVEVEFNQIALDHVQLLMLCSDGLTNMVSKEDLVEYFNQYYNDMSLGDKLIDAANEAGGMDNITVIIASNIERLTGGES